jgi:hypothetical protein
MASQKRETPLAGGEFAKENTKSTEIVRENFPGHKAFTPLRARFGLLGHELHGIAKGGQVYYEIRRSGQARTCSTLHDLEGFLAVLGDRVNDQRNAE